MSGSATYRMLDGNTVDLSRLTDRETAFFQLCYTAYERRFDWAGFSNIVFSRANPLVNGDGMITADTMTHPMFQPLRDLEDRIGIRDGDLLADDDDALGPPMAVRVPASA